VAHLKRENTRLEEERAFLKKAAVYFAKPSTFYNAVNMSNENPFPIGLMYRFYRFNVVVHLPLWKRGIEGDLSKKISPNPSFSKRGTE
jgi:hypothetical protein